SRFPAAIPAPWHRIPLQRRDAPAPARRPEVPRPPRPSLTPEVSPPRPSSTVVFAWTGLLLLAPPSVTVAANQEELPTPAGSPSHCCWVAFDSRAFRFSTSALKSSSLM